MLITAVFSINNSGLSMRCVTGFISKVVVVVQCIMRWNKVVLCVCVICRYIIPSAFLERAGGVVFKPLQIWTGIIQRGFLVCFFLFVFFVCVYNTDCTNCGDNQIFAQLVCGHYLCSGCWEGPHDWI